MWPGPNVHSHLTRHKSVEKLKGRAIFRYSTLSLWLTGIWGYFQRVAREYSVTAIRKIDSNSSISENHYIIHNIVQSPSCTKSCTFWTFSVKLLPHVIRKILCKAFIRCIDINRAETSGNVWMHRTTPLFKIWFKMDGDNFSNSKSPEAAPDDLLSNIQTAERLLSTMLPWYPWSTSLQPAPPPWHYTCFSRTYLPITKFPRTLHKLLGQMAITHCKTFSIPKITKETKLPSP